MTAIFSNLLINSVFSLACGLLVVGFFIWLFRVQEGPWKLFLLSLPFLKIVYDCFRGMPADSILFAGLDPFMLPPRHQALTAGAGFKSGIPTLNVEFTVHDIDGQAYAASVGDYLAIWAEKTFGKHIPLAVICFVLGVSLLLLTVRFVQAFRFEKQRRQDRKFATVIRTEKIWRRSVDVYLSKTFSGTPFTGGFLNPYICIPLNAYQKLTPPELEAVIAHEVGHIRQCDLVVTVMVQLLGDIFWFLPGYRWLSRKIDRLREVVADQWAVRSGIRPALLASALVQLKDIPEPSDSFILYSAFFREKSLLKIRVHKLLGNTVEKPSRFGWQNRWVRCAATAWIVASVMVATLGGNQHSGSIANPEWITQALHALGIT